jgi:hypothetical protein
MHTTNNKLILLSLIFLPLITQLNAQTITVPQSAPYTNDANTVLLQHFDSTTSGSTNGAVTYTNGVFGNAVHLNDSAWISWSISALPQGTIEFWGKLDSLTNSGDGTLRFITSYYSQFYAATAYVEVFNDGTNANRTIAGINTTPFAWNDIGSTLVYVKPPTNTWHHYALTWGNNGLHYYLDGVLVCQTSNTSGQNSSTGWWCIGNQGGDGFNGAIDELRISNIQRIYTPAPSQITFVKAFTLDYQNLQIGSNYQAQASPDLATWTNWGAAFTATSSTYTNTSYQRIANWNQLFFRLMQQ